MDWSWSVVGRVVGSLLCLAVTLPVSVAVGQADFPISEIVSTGEDGPRAVAVGDLDGDGTQDIVVGSDQAGTLTRYMNQGGGAFSSDTTIASNINNARDVLLADIDGQNGLDIVVAEGDGSTSSDDEISWFPNNGDGSFGLRQDVATSGNSIDDPRSVAAGDINNDGNVDIAAAGQDGSTVFWYANQGDSTFTKNTITSNPNGPRDVALGDVDGDGLPDVVWTDVSSDEVRWKPNGSGSAGSFGTSQAVGGGHTNPVDVEVADLNGNGPDAIIAVAGEDAVRVVANNGSGGFESSGTTLAATVDSASAVHAAEVGGDGNLDLLAAAGQSNEFIRFVNEGSLSFNAKVFETAADEAQDIVAADLDGDGAADPVGASYADDTVAFYPNISIGPTIYVDADKTGGRQYGTSWGDAFTSLQNALAVAESGDSLWVAEGTYYPDDGDGIASGRRDTSFVVTGAKDSLAIYGGFDGSESILSNRDPVTHTTTLSGDIGVVGDSTDNSYHVLRFDGTTSSDITGGTRLDGVTVTAGNANGTSPNSLGGGLYCNGGGSGNACSPTLTNVTFRANTASGGGGALYNDGGSGGTSSPRIGGCTFENNDAGANGGAVYNDGQSGTSNPFISGSLFLNNTAASTSRGGAIYNLGDNGVSSPVIELSTFEGNRATTHGGAIYSSDGTGESNPRISGSVFRQNVAEGDGGALYSAGDGDADNPTIAGNYFTGNRALASGPGAGGGAIFNDGSHAVIINNAFVGNDAVNGNAGAIFNNGSDPKIVNVTITLNTAAEEGGAIKNYSDGSPDISNTILWDNTATDGAEMFNATGTDPTIAYTIVEGGDSGVFDADGQTPFSNGPNNLNQDPGFNSTSTLAGSDGTLITDDDSLVIAETSPAVDAGNNDSLDADGDGFQDVSSDIVGAARVQDNGGGSTVNLGAYEVTAPVAADSIIHVDRSASGANDGSSWSDAYTDLQTAIDNATSSSELWIAEGIYKPDNEGDSFRIDGAQDGITIYGGFEGTESTRSAREPAVHRTILSGDLNGDDVDPDSDGIIEDADPNQDGAPENLKGGENAHTVLFLAGGGGGNITEQTVIDGLYITAGQADNSSASENFGGGLYCYGKSSGEECSPTLNNMVFAGNAADDRGGALINNGQSDGISSPTITNTTFIGNASNDGGAIHNLADNGGRSSPTITNAVFVNNASSGRGGAISGDAFTDGTTSPTITNVTFTNNAAAGNGGAMINDGGTSTPEITNTIFWGNRSSSSGDEIYNNNATSKLSHTIIQGGVNGSGVGGNANDDLGGNLDRHPRFEYAPLPAGDDGTSATDDDGLHLTPESPAIDAGVNDSVDVTVDLTGASRVQNSTVDIGAYEGGRDQARTIYVDQSATGTADGTSWADADTTLQAPSDIGSGAFSYATGNDEIRIAEGTYTPASAADSFAITGAQDSLEVYGGYPTDGGTRDPQANPTVLSGDVAGDDGVFEPNTDSDANSGTPRQTDHLVAPNSHHVLYLDGTRGGTITRSTVIDGVIVEAGLADGNSATPRADGAGLYCDGSGSGNACSPTLNRVVFQANEVDEHGGAVYNDGGNGGTARPLLENVVIAHNVADTSGISEGGGMANRGASPTLKNGVIYDNFSAADGGGIYNKGLSGDGARPRLMNVTMSKNAALGSGGALFNDGSSGPAAPHLENTILWGDLADDNNNDTGTGDEIHNSGSDAIPTMSHSVVDTPGSNTTGIRENNGSSTVYQDASDNSVSFANSTNRSQAPQFVNAAALRGGDATLATRDDGLNLTPGSSAIDAGSNDSVSVSTDLLGRTRPQDLDGDGTATVNAGAYERPVTAAPTAATQTVSATTDSSATIEGAVNPGGLETTVTVRYDDDATLGSTQTLSAGTFADTAFTTQSVSATLNDLSPGTTYNYSITSDNGSGSAVGDTLTAITDVVSPSGTADGATNVTTNEATLNGTVNLGGDTTRVYVKLTNTATSDVSVYAADTLTAALAESQSVSVTTPDTLKSGTGYEYEVSAANSVDSVSVGTASFTTLNPLSVTATAPTANTVSADTALSALTVTFNHALDGTTIAPDSVEVHGAQSGRIEEEDGSVQIQSDTTLVYELSEDFQPGEHVAVTVAGGIADTFGTALDKGYTFGFTAQAGDGPATFPVDDTIAATADDPTSMKPADLDGDGDLDLAVAVNGTNTVAWLRNDGNGTFSKQTITTDLSGVSSVYATDIDGDGHPDLVASAEGNESGTDGQTISWFENQIDESSGFASRRIITNNVSEPGEVHAADLDGDGDPDVLSASWSDNRVAWYENQVGEPGADSDGFGPQQTIFQKATTFPQAVSAGDLDGDGDLDVLTGSEKDDRLAWHENQIGEPGADSDGFGPRQVISTAYGWPAPVRVADLNGDGLLDVLTASYQDSIAAWHKNQGGGSFSAQKTIDTPDGGTVVPTGDLDGDDDLDIVLGPSNGEVTWHENDGTGSFAPRMIAGAFGETGIVATADLDGDGDLDVLSTDNIGNQILWHPNMTTAPQVVAKADSNRTADGFFARAQVNPGGLQTEVAVQYSENRTFGSDSAATADSSPITGDDTLSVSASVSGLDPNTTYYYRVRAENDKGTTTGAVDSVSTRIAPPQVTTEAPTVESDSSAVLNGTVNPGGDTTAVYAAIAVAGGDLTADSSLVDSLGTDLAKYQDANLRVDTLRPGVQYDYRITAINDSARTAGQAVTFTTAPDAVADETVVERGASERVDAPANDVGSGIDPSTVTVETTPDHGSASVDPNDGNITYAHDGSGARRDTLTYTVANDAGQRSEAAVVAIDIVDLQVQAGEAVRGDTVNVTVRAIGPFAPSTASIYARKGGTSGYTIVDSTEITSPSSDTATVSGTISKDLVTTQGIDYYAQFADGSDTLTVPAGGPGRAQARPAHLPVTFEGLAPDTSRATVAFREKQYRMASVPGVPTGGIKAALEGAYGPYDPTQWRVLRWDGAEAQNREYPALDTLKPGQGFWLTTRRGIPPSVSGGQTVQADRAYRIPLTAGWNQVGTPFGFAVPWSAVRDSSGLSAGAVDGPFAYREESYEADSLLAPWEGYFVFSAEADTLVVPPVGTPDAKSSREPLAKAFGGAASSTRAKSGGSERTTLTVEAATKAGRETARLGLWPGAKDGRDGYDQAKPPSVEPGLELAAMEKVGGRAVPHAGSAKPAETAGGGTGQSWRLRLSAPEGEERRVKLFVKEAGMDRSVYLLDLSREERVLRGAELTLEAGETRVLKTIVGSKGYASAKSEGIDLDGFKTKLRGAYPNPFQERATVEYVLSEAQEVTVEVYDVLGRKVRTLAKGEQEAGVHRVRWDGKSRQGVPVGSGMYFVRMRAKNQTQTKKLVRVR